MPKAREDRLQETSASPRGPYVTAQAVAAHLSVSARVIRRLSQQGVIPSLRVGTRHCFDLEKVIAALERPREARSAEYEKQRLRLMRLTRGGPV